MQSPDEVQRICHQGVLDAAEAHANASEALCGCCWWYVHDPSEHGPHMGSCRVGGRDEEVSDADCACERYEDA